MFQKKDLIRSARPSLDKEQNSSLSDRLERLSCESATVSLNRSSSEEAQLLSQVNAPVIDRVMDRFVNDEEAFKIRRSSDAAISCLHEIFELQASKTPSKIAIECGDRSWTYADVEAQANRLAHYLRFRGVCRDGFVGLTLTRSEWPIISILAVLKAGAAYVPLEPSMPADRKRYIAKEVGFSLLITDEQNEAAIKDVYNGEVALLERFLLDENDHVDTALSADELSALPHSVCYTLFTSGTTGRPKGVVTEHRNTVHFVHAFNKVCDTKSDDRVFQGFSLGFDGSVEEMWMAFSNGATLVCGENETPQFGDELGEYLNEKEISFFSTVPTLLSTLSSDLLSVRQLVVSGEACPPDLVNRWATSERVMLNVYGPTEATVNTTAGILEKGKDVTIGRPLPGYDLYILDENLKPVAEGEKGELYIGGAGISRCYLNQQELTDNAFINLPVPRSSMGDEADAHLIIRLYKTGDLVRVNGEGELEFFGRIDSQIKLRGFRIELSEIEAVILEHDAISAVAVTVCEVNGLKSLAAYVLVAGDDRGFSRSDLLAKMQDKLPSYMIPSFMDVLDEFPRVASGKVNRGALPEPTLHFVHEQVEKSEKETASLNPLEAEIAGIWADQFGLEHVGADQDYFTELGGHSLLAAQMVSRFYEILGRKVSVRDIYMYPTVAKLAAELTAQEAALESSLDIKPSDTFVAEKVKRVWPWSTLIIQIVYFLAIIPLVALPLVLVLPVAIETIYTQSSPLLLFLLSLCVIGGTWMGLLVLAVAAKWLLIGCYRPGRHALWGGFYIRWWIVSRLQHLSFMSALNGTPFNALIWRAMGAKVGRNSMLNPSLVYAFDCIRVGDDVSIGRDTQMPCLRIEDGYLIIGDLEIGDRCFVGNHSILGLNTRMEADARLDDQSLLPDGYIAHSGKHYRGSPPVEGVVPVPDGAIITHNPYKLALFGLVQIIAAACVMSLTLAPVAISVWVLSILALHYSAMVTFTAYLIAVPLTLFLFTFWSAFCKRLVYPNPEPGTYQVYSLTYLRHWLSDLVMSLIKLVGLSIFTTIYLPPFMRMLGAKLGKYTEMSTVWSINPDMVEAGDSVFFADGSMIGGARVHLGRFQVEKSVIGDRSFIGNSAILSAGNSVGSDCLLGVLSSTPDQQKPIEDNTDWLGAPGFRLPNRDKITCFDEKLTFKPTRWLYLQRAFIDGLRVVLPGYILGGFAIFSLLTVLLVYDNYGVWGAYTAIPLLTWGALATCLFTVVSLKWLIMGRFKPVVKPLWSRYVWWNEFVNGLYESLVSPWISNFFGTPFAAVLLRLMGCKIGKYCYIETDLFSEFDLVKIGDYAALNAGVVVQNHLFEDRVMKSSYVNIGDGCTVGNMSVVLYDSVMEEGSVLGPMSLLLKGETMPVNENWHGIPTSRQIS